MARPTTSDLCVECGLCCDGSLFADVELANERESTLMESCGASVDLDEDSPLLIQPCSALRGKSCSIYTHRPKCCRTFECLLLKQVKQGDISHAVARSRIRSALDLKAKIESLISLPSGDEQKLSFNERCQDAISSLPSNSHEAKKLEQFADEFEMLVRDVFLGNDVSA